MLTNAVEIRDNYNIQKLNNMNMKKKFMSLAFSGKASRLAAKVSTQYTGGYGPSSSLAEKQNAASLQSAVVTCKTTKGRKAFGYGSITYNGVAQSSSPSVSY